MNPNPDVLPDNGARKRRMTAAFAGAALVGLAAWEFGPAALSSAQAFFSAAGTTTPTLTPVFAGVGSAGAGALDQAFVAGTLKAAGATAAVIGAARAANGHYTYATGNTSIGNAESGEGEHPNGVFEESPKHGPEARSGPQGEISAGPKNGQGVLDKSIKVKPTSSQRVGIDPNSDEFVVFREHLPGRFHGYVTTWEELAAEARSALIRAGRVTARGRIIKP